MNFTRFILVCFVAVALSSCLDDGDGVEYGYYYSTIGIIEENGDGGCYVETDTGKKLLVSNPRDVLAEVSDGDRVYVEFNLDDRNGLCPVLEKLAPVIAQSGGDADNTSGL